MKVKIERLGIYKRFPNLKKYCEDFYYDVEASTKLENLKRFSTGESFSIAASEYMDAYQYETKDASHEFKDFSSERLFSSIIDRLSGKASENFLQYSMYYYWAIRLDTYLKRADLAQYEQGQLDQFYSMVELRDFTMALSNITINGWFEYITPMLEELYYFYDRNIDIVNGGNSEYQPSKAQYFILRLLNDWKEIEDINFPESAYIEPLYNTLIENWKTQDEELIQHLLLCACDRHTHESRYNTATQFFDFGAQQLFYFPYEVLIVLRLRQELGLNNPIIEHIIMNTEVGKLGDTTDSHDYIDDLLTGFMKQAKSEYPNFAPDFVISLSNENNNGKSESVNEKAMNKKTWKFWKK